MLPEEGVFARTWVIPSPWPGVIPEQVSPLDHEHYRRPVVIHVKESSPTIGYPTERCWLLGKVFDFRFLTLPTKLEDHNPTHTC